MVKNPFHKGQPLEDFDKLQKRINYLDKKKEPKQKISSPKREASDTEEEKGDSDSDESIIAIKAGAKNKVIRLQDLSFIQIAKLSLAKLKSVSMDFIP